MFTGLIEEIGIVRRAERAGEGLAISIAAARVMEESAVGDSICIDGACQTVTAIRAEEFEFFCSRVTAGLTTLGGFRPGRRVNLERAMSMRSRLGGHIVQGHVDGRGIVRNARRDAGGLALEISAPPEILRYIIPRGSVAVDGVSLTVVSLNPGVFSLYLIPETMRNTTLPEKSSGDEVNIEVDVLAKYVERLLGRGGAQSPSSDESLKKKLAEEGFI